MPPEQNIRTGSPVAVMSDDGKNAAAVLAASTSPAVTDPALVVALSPNGGSSFVGLVGGSLASTSVTPTVTAGAYSTGQVIGGVMTFASMARAAGKTGYVTAASASSKVANTVEIDLFIFNATPSNSTTTDHGAFALSSLDFTKLCGVIPLTGWYAGGTPSVGYSDTCRVPAVGLAASSIYVVAVARGAITFTGTSDITFQLVEDQN